MRFRLSHAIPRVAQENLASWKHLKSTAPPVILGGNLPRMHKFPIAIKTSTTSATSLIDHAQLKCCNTGFRTKGKTIPPTLEPTKVMPEASPRLTSNQCATTARAVVVRKAALVPLKIP